MFTRPVRLLALSVLVLATGATAWAQFTEAAGKVRDAVITVAAADRTGTGFIVNPEGHALTNKHVVGDATSVDVKLRNGDQATAEVVKSATERDLCLLKISRQHLPSVQFASSGKLKQGQDVAAVGAPFGLSNSLTKGVVSATDRDIEGQKFIQIDAALNQGNSGGPIITQEGMVVGVATKAAKEAQSVGFAIPSDVVMEFLTANTVTYQAALGDAPKAAGGEASPPGPPAEGPQTAEGAPAPPAMPPAPVPAQPAASLLSNPVMLLVIAACVAFVVALITALVVAGRRPAAQVAQAPVSYVYSQPPAAGQPVVRQAAPPAQQAPPAQEDLSDIDIELR